MPIFDVIYPKVCLDCNKKGSYICLSCLEKVRKPNQFCIYCNRPSQEGKTHEKCKGRLSLEGYYSAWKYEEVIKKAILKIKYKFVFEIAEEIALRLSENLKKGNIFIKKDILLVPIPLHRKKEKWRGFNQARKIGEILARINNWDISDNLLIKTKDTKPQTTLTKTERKKNVIGVFQVDKDEASNVNNNKQIVLFDDVYTTGTTIKEAAKTLRKSLNNNAWGLTVASS